MSKKFRQTLRAFMLGAIVTTGIGVAGYGIFSIANSDKPKTEEERIDELAILAEAGELSKDNRDQIDKLFRSSSYQILILSYEEYKELMKAVDANFVNSIQFITASSSFGSYTIYITIDNSWNMEPEEESEILNFDVKRMDDQELEIYLLKNGGGKIFDVERIKSNGFNENIVTILLEAEEHS